jgi:hypothetical protein
MTKLSALRYVGGISMSRILAKYLSKITLALLLCSGVFIIVASILRLVLSLQSLSGIQYGASWAMRESVSAPSQGSKSVYQLLVQFVATVVVSLAPTKPLFTRRKPQQLSYLGSIGTWGSKPRKKKLEMSISMMETMDEELTALQQNIREAVGFSGPVAAMANSDENV